jgi:5,6-dimethylbenzimidazole synthase
MLSLKNQQKTHGPFCSTLSATLRSRIPRASLALIFETLLMTDSAATHNPHRYSDADIAAVYRAIFERRDMRHFIPGELPEGLLGRLIEAAHHAPSVGYMQPWRFLRVSDTTLRRQLHAIVDVERHAMAKTMPSRDNEFMQLKVEGITECAEVLVVALMDGREPHLFGRRTLPEMDLASVACAIQNMWLAARAEGIGLGWVSIFAPESLVKLLSMPVGAKPVAILCIGPVAEFPAKPLLETTHWGQRLPFEQILFDNVWPADAKPTPTAY